MQPTERPAPPRAERRPHVWARPTGEVDDPYAWMRDTDDPALHAYLDAENDHTARWFAPHEDLVEELFTEIRSRVQETDESVPVFNGGWWYVTTTEEGRSYPAHRRGRTRDTAAEHLVLDENVEAGDDDYFDLGAFDVSHDHTLLAWSTDTTGDERYTLRVRRLGDDGTTEELPDVIDGVANAGVAWSRDGRWLFYVRPDDQERPFQVWCHHLGGDEPDRLVLEEPDERFFVEVGETRSDRWIVIQSASKTTSEVRLLPSDDPGGEPRVVMTRRLGVDYQVDDWGDTLVMVTDDDAVDFRVLVAPTADGWDDPAAWTELVPHEPGRRVLGVDAFAGHLVVAEWADAQPRLRIVFRDRTERIVDLGDEPHDVAVSANPEWTATTIRFTTQSLTSPPTLLEEDVATGARTVLRRTPTPNVDLGAYRSERRWATSVDGTLVPVDLARHVDTPLDGTAPCVVYGYGAYEASLPVWFSVARLSLLDRGVVWALAHPRGGGELGRRWYLDGKLLAKRNSFDDMTAAARHLADEGLVDPSRVGLRGGSAGGLLVGACTVQHPEHWASIVAEVPFVDIVNSMSDPSLPLTVTEWEEWGDPRHEPHASAMLEYSPYDNTVPADYPAIYVTAGLHDPRVSVHEPAKWVARLRDAATGDRPILLRTEMGAGHGGPTGRYDAWRDEARTLVFQLLTL